MEEYSGLFALKNEIDLIDRHGVRAITVSLVHDCRRALVVVGRFLGLWLQHLIHFNQPRWFYLPDRN